MKQTPTSTKRIGITGVGMHVPAKVLSNFDIEKMVDTTDEWIQTRTGIKERRIAEPGTTTSDLACKAAKEALAEAKLDPKDLAELHCLSRWERHVYMPTLPT